jgi:hypothetical protein
VIRRLGLLALLALPACGGSDEAPRADPPPVCEPGVPVPSGFEPLDTFEEPYADHVGVRLGFRDDERRELHILAGIPGEFGEGTTPAGELDLTQGRTGRLYEGVEGVWLVVWEEDDPCDPRVVIANGFTRDVFLDALVDAGLLPPSVDA